MPGRGSRVPDGLDGTGAFDIKLARGLTLGLAGNYGKREGTRPLGFGTYVRRQALTGVPGTGAGFFWRESIEARGNELAEPLDHSVTEGGVTLTWIKKGHSIAAGWFGSHFRNDITSLYFDNPFEGAPGRASASIAACISTTCRQVRFSSLTFSALSIRQPPPFPD